MRYPSHNADSKLIIWKDSKLVPYAEGQNQGLCHTMHHGTGAFEGVGTDGNEGWQNCRLPRHRTLSALLRYHEGNWL